MISLPIAITENCNKRMRSEPMWKVEVMAHFSVLIPWLSVLSLLPLVHMVFNVFCVDSCSVSPRNLDLSLLIQAWICHYLADGIWTQECRQIPQYLGFSSFSLVCLVSKCDETLDLLRARTGLQFFVCFPFPLRSGRMIRVWYHSAWYVHMWMQSLTCRSIYLPNW